MHILLVHQAFAALTDPGGTRHHELALFLAERGHQVTIVASPVSYLTGKSIPTTLEDGGHPNIRILRPPVYSKIHRSFIHRVVNFITFMLSSFWTGLQVRKVDLVWGTSPPIFQGLTAWVLSRLKRVPFLFEVRDLWPAFAVAVGVLDNPELIRVSEWLEHFLYRHADRLVVNSPGFIQHVKDRGAPEVHLIPNGADVTMFDPEDDGTVFRQANRLESQFIALYAGAHGMSNDLDVLLEAAWWLRDVPNLAIVLLGDGKEKPGLQQRASELKLTNLHFLPPVAKTDMPMALAAADVCIAILKPVEMYKTVYPNKVFDYMAAGRPIILAIDGVIREVVESAQAGTVVKPGDAKAIVDAIRFYATHPAQVRLQGQNGRLYLETHFDRKVLAQGLLEIMQAMLHQER